MKLLNLALPLLAIPWLPSRLLDEHRIVYAPQEGTTLVREIRNDGLYHLESYQSLVNGEEVEGDPPEGRDATFRRFVITDVVEAMGDGHPVLLQRTFDRLSRGTVEPGTETPEESPHALVSDLEGHTVRVVWDPEAEAYVFEADEDEEIDERLLAPLEEDLDSRSFLPDGEVTEGDEWDLPVAAGVSLIWTGGLHSLRGQDGEVDAWFWEQELANIDSAECEGRAVFADVRDEDGRTLAVITFETELSAGVSLIQEGETADMADLHWTSRETYAHEGTLLWDLDANHMHSLRTSWTERMSVGIGLVWDVGGSDWKEEEVEVGSLEGTFVVTVEAAAPEASESEDDG